MEKAGQDCQEHGYCQLLNSKVRSDQRLTDILARVHRGLRVIEKGIVFVGVEAIPTIGRNSQPHLHYRD
ncbi:hypothetical protein SERLADRAFT_390915 [Serpula lacrymans var. lacrymans S7.9]|uniref:Uncharacterized protein n=1 Tax=Serpula lacrymans var. lacrymans (strain S7.9) TaxID=578457 RepID=F8NVZ4_SERL9|nr:uncharacterized protein SERLADRAFT_390915 [Serpula lacrymans var. lacrymans S7.9]EGO24928.1 hypothetical protein SERLADRAFT_390915 [Serpula lacrymans var. lacrymans S7.9]